MNWRTVLCSLNHQCMVHVLSEICQCHVLRELIYQCLLHVLHAMICWSQLSLSTVSVSNVLCVKWNVSVSCVLYEMNCPLYVLCKMVCQCSIWFCVFYMVLCVLYEMNCHCQLFSVWNELSVSAVFCVKLTVSVSCVPCEMNCQCQLCSVWNELSMSAVFCVQEMPLYQIGDIFEPTAIEVGRIVSVAQLKPWNSPCCMRN